MPRDKTGHFYFSWYPTIYQADTQSLTLSEDGAYRRLIDHYMLTRSPLPSDDRALARIIGIGIDEWLEMKNRVGYFFKPSTNPDGYLTHSFCDEILAKDVSRINKCRTAGKLGGRPVKHGKTKGITQTVIDSKPITELNRTEQKESKKESSSASRFTLIQLPDDWKQFCIQERPDLDPMETFKWFRDYWIAVAGAKGRKLDWFATWRNWIRNQHTKGNNYGKSDRPKQKISNVVTL